MLEASRLASQCNSQRVRSVGAYPCVAILRALSGDPDHPTGVAGSRRPIRCNCELCDVRKVLEQPLEQPDHGTTQRIELLAKFFVAVAVEFHAVQQHRRQISPEKAHFRGTTTPVPELLTEQLPEHAGRRPMPKPVGLTLTKRGYEYRQRVPRDLQAVIGVPLFYRYLGRIGQAAAEHHARTLRAHFDQIINEARQLNSQAKRDAIRSGGYLKSRRLDIAVDTVLTTLHAGTIDAPQFDTDAPRNVQADQLLASHELEQSAAAAQQRQQQRQHAGASMSGVVERWQRRTNPRSKGTIRQAHVWLDRFQQVTGCRSPHDVTLQHAIAARDAFEGMADAGHFTRATARHGWQRLTSLFDVLRSDGVIQANPFASTRVAVPATMAAPAVRGFTDSQVRRILDNLDQLQRADHRWLIRLSLYTAARVGDLVNLHVDDVSHGTGGTVLDINAARPGSSLKTRSAIRLVPVPTTISTDFNAFVSASSGMLFKGSTPRQAATFFQRVGNNYLRAIGMNDTAHALRHTAIGKLRSAGVAEHVIAAIAGHAGGRSVTAGYGRGVDLATMAAALELIRY